MGGTFDPIHNAHLVLAECAYREYVLDQVWMLPNGNPPHKRDLEQQTVQHRAAMIRLAIQGRPYLSLCEMEISGREYHYTYETLRRLNAQHPDTDFYFIMGADSLLDFEDWVHPELISRECRILAAVRDGCGQKELRSHIRGLEERVGAQIYLLHTPDMEVASSQIREKLRRGEDASGDLPEEVLRYIKEHRLYGGSAGG